jgi:hypothetical protein
LTTLYHIYCAPTPRTGRRVRRVKSRARL